MTPGAGWRAAEQSRVSSARLAGQVYAQLTPLQVAAPSAPPAPRGVRPVAPAHRLLWLQLAVEAADPVLPVAPHPEPWLDPAVRSRCRMPGPDTTALHRASGYSQRGSLPRVGAAAGVRGIGVGSSGWGNAAPIRPACRVVVPARRCRPIGCGTHVDALTSRPFLPIRPTGCARSRGCLRDWLAPWPVDPLPRRRRTFFELARLTAVRRCPAAVRRWARPAEFDVRTVREDFPILSETGERAPADLVRQCGYHPEAAGP